MGEPGYLIGPDFLGRIRRTVDAAEGSPYRMAGATRIETRFESDDGGGVQQVFRICTYTGSWSVNSNKVVTFKFQTNTPNTVSVSNVLFQLPQFSSNPLFPTDCAIAKDGTAWYLVNVMHVNHSVLTDVTLTPTNLQFGRRDVLTISTTGVTTGISVASCNTAQASATALSYYQ